MTALDIPMYTSLDPKMRLRKYKIEVENQLDQKIKRFRTDKDGEYESNSLTAFCEKKGIIHEATIPRTSQQNGIVESKNKILKEIMNVVLLS